MKKHKLFFIPLLFALSVSSYNLEGIFPHSGPTYGETRVTIYSPTFQGMNYTDHPTPKCQFPNSEPQEASWIHCYGSATNPSPVRDQTCLNCESRPNPVGTVAVKVSIKGDFTDTATIPFTFYVQPNVTFATPYLGYKTGGTFIQVNGENFINSTDLTCSFGTVHVPATYVSPTMVTCRSPPSDIVDAAIPLRVSQNNQQYTRTKIHYYYHTVPEISSLFPDEGPITGGNEVYIRGRQMQPFQYSNDELYYQNTSFVRFGPDHVSRLEIINRTHIRTLAPPSASASPVVVEISFNNQEWTNNGILYYYYLSPYVVKLVPNTGILEGGTNVTVIGANLFPSEEVRCRFGEHIVDGTYINETAVWCIAPEAEHVGPVDFSLTIEKNHFSSANLKYTYFKKPVIGTIAPLCGPTFGNTQIAVRGENFIYTGANRAFCIFGQNIRQPATIINSTLLYCDSPNVLDRFGNNINDISKLHFSLTLNDVEIINSKFDFHYYTQSIITGIEPKIGPVEGNTGVLVSGSNFTGSCGILCRFATIEVPGVLLKSGQISCKSPSVPCPGDSVVQITLNGQQFTDNNYDLQDAVFTNYELPVVAYALPLSFPTGGDASVGVYGSQFLLSKNSSVLASGAIKITYQCRFRQGSGGKILGTANSSYFTDSYIHCKTPRLESASKDVVMEISADGQRWIEVPNQKLTFYNSPEIQSLVPSFGRIKQEKTTLVVKGRFLDCPNNVCDNVKCSFSGANYKVVTDGSRKSSSEVICDIPSLSRPDQTLVQITMNGVDFTTQKVYYTFYDAFVVNLDPPYIPVEGNVEVKVIGLGFAETPQLKVRLEDSQDNSVLMCGGAKSPCVIPAKFISPTELSFVAPPQASVHTANGESIGFRPLQVEVSIYEDSFTNNNVQLNYYQQPKVGANLTLANKTSYVFHANAVSTIFVPIKISVPESVREDEFLRKARILCRFTVAGQVVTTEGKVVEYPYPVKGKFDNNLESVQCPTPYLTQPGKGTVSISLNGFNFVGDLPVTALPQLKIETVGPKCGPREGGTKIDLMVEGVQPNDIGNLHFSWSSICTDPFTEAMFKNNHITTVTPAAPNQTTTGGQSLVVFTAKEKVDFQDASSNDQIRNHFEASSDFLYYRRPIITRVSPHGGLFTGGTPVIVEGAFFFSEPKFMCTPKCIFGNNTVEAEFISSVRIRCVSPPGKLGEFVPLQVTINGQDIADSPVAQTFAYIGVPSISNILPAAGPSTGGTVIYLTGKDFVDMSKYPEEFLCIFRPIESAEPPRVMPAFFINSTSVSCSTPGGWQAGTIVNIAVSFNGIDFSKDESRFRFYQINKVFPVSGPSIGGSEIRITGSGLTPDSKVGEPACKIGSQVTTAISANNEEIVCVLPAASAGPAYHGHVDFFYTLDGQRWEHVLQGFTYYQQPDVSQVIPKFISANGGKLRVVGNNFVANFAEGIPSCRIDNTIVQAENITNNEITCVFNSVEFDEDNDHYLQVTLNNDSFTGKVEAAKINVFKASSMKPSAGLIQGGTHLIVSGKNFPSDLTPQCKFGSIVTEGKALNKNKVLCQTPAAIILAEPSQPFNVPFMLGFGDKETGKFLINFFDLFIKF